MERTSIEGLTVYAQRPDVATGSPLLFVHGYLAGSWVFRGMMRFFAERGHPCHAVDLRGRGGSRPGTDVGAVSVHEFASDARIVAESLGTPIVVGHSMGGLVAQMLAAEGCVRATVLLAPAPPRGIPVISLRALPYELRYLPAILRSRPVVARWADFEPIVLNAVPASERRAVFEKLVPDSGRAAREMLLGAISVDEGRVRTPMLVAGGTDDRFVPFPAIRRVAAKYGAELIELARHGHMLPVEPEWEALAMRMSDWIDAHVEREARPARA